MKRAGPKESVIQAQILAYLERRGDCFVWRNNTGSFSPRPGAFVRFGTPGSADILGVRWGGQLLAVEVKTSTGRLRPAQERWGAEVTRFGGLYIVARSVDDVDAALGPVLNTPAPTKRRVLPGCTE